MKLTTSCTGNSLCLFKPIIHLLSYTLLLLFISTAAKAQQHTIQGTVIDNSTEKPLVNATVKLKNSKLVTQTDEEGKFILQMDGSEGVLEVSYLGYETKEIPVQGTDKMLTVRLRPEENLLEEVEVNTGYQTIPKERATGSFSVVPPSLLNDRTSTNIISKLNGIASGLVFNKHGVTGQSELMIRGRGTIFADESPLIVVDDFPYEGDISNLNPNDVESIVILKDAAAASIWGVRAGNGVIVINTKKGAFNRDLDIQIKSNISISAKPDLFYNPNFLTSPEFIEMERFLFEEDFYQADIISRSKVPLTPVVELLYAKREGEITPSTADNLIKKYKSYDIRREKTDHFFRNAINQEYAFDVSGGSKSHSYYFSSGYDRNLSNEVQTDYTRFSISAKNRLKLTDRLLLRLGLDYVQSKHQRNLGGTNLNVRNGKDIYPYARLTDNSGKPIVLYKDFRRDFVESASEKGLLDWEYIPLNDLGLSNAISLDFNTRIKTGLSYRLENGLNAEVKYLYQSSATQTDELAQMESYYVRDLINTYSTVTSEGIVSKLDNIPLGDILDKANSRYFTHNLRGQLNFSRDFDQHKIDAIVGMELKLTRRRGQSHRIYGYDDETGSSQTIEFPTKSFALYPFGTSTVIPKPGYITGGEDRFRSYFTNIAYSYKNYTISASGRIDQSNFFGVRANQRSGPLWSSGLKWTISDEPFFKITWLPKASLRATYGYNGNLDRALTGVTTIFYYPGGDILSDLQYADLNSIGNPNLRWEKTSMLNIGLDFQTKDNTLSGTLDYFKKWGRDLIGDSPMPSSSGVSEFRGNFADMNGQGIDLTLNSINIDKTFKWKSSLHLSYAIDKIEKYGIQFDPRFYLGANGNTFDKYPIEGYPLYSVFSLPWGGLDPLNGNPLGKLLGEPSDDYRELNAPSINDLIYHGPAKPVVFGNIYNRLSFSNLALSFNVTYKLGYYFRRSSINYNALFTRWNGHVDFVNRWRQPGDELLTSVPSMVYPNDINRDLFYQSTSVLVEKGDHIRLQYINLSYDFTTTLNQKVSMSKLRFYLQMENLGIVWRANNRGIDPEYQAYGNGSGISTPAPFIVTTGLTLTF